MSQFTKYSWNDASAPQLTGSAGSLIAVLDACLVTGYGAKTAAGWSHPVATAGNCASYKQGAASKAGYAFQLNDNGPNVTATFKEAWATGWKVCTAVTAPVGTGTGQFPTAAQLLTTGHVVIRKSATADATSIRPWTVYADDRTVYLFMRTGDGNTIYDFGFGEFFSLFGASDIHNCFITGRGYENNTGAGGGLDRMNTPASVSGTDFRGSYFADNYGGSSGSQIACPNGDEAKSSVIRANSTIIVPTSGSLATPNQADNSYYMAPLHLLDTSWLIRGRYRGLQHLCHPSSYLDGKILTGSNANAGKTFHVLSPGPAGGNYCVEVSDTLETN